MTLVIVHGGQRGVDRGAHVGALAAGLTITGYMPKDARDEDGLIPPDVAKFLMRCLDGGFAARTKINLVLAHLVLIVVPSASDPRVTPGTRLTIDEARYRGLPRQIIDPTWDSARVRDWVYQLHDARERAGHTVTRLMVAGPRESLWSSGEQEAAAFVAGLAPAPPLN